MFGLGLQIAMNTTDDQSLALSRGLRQLPGRDADNGVASDVAAQ